MRLFLIRIRCHAFWLNLPSALLILILQRTPVVKIATLVEEIVVAVPLGSVLRSAVAVTAGLSVHSLAGATELAPSSPSPLAATVGTPVSVGFSITGTLSDPERWFITGSVPPGLSFDGVTSGTVLGSTVLLSGTPTTAGSYSIGLQAKDDPTGTVSVVFNYQVNVTNAAPTAPAFTTHPQSQSVNVGANVSFTVAADGNPAPTFQWRKDGVNIAGATSATLALTNVQLDAAATYTAVATNSAGSATSNGAVLSVASATAAPAFTAHPQNFSIAVNGSITFTVETTGVPEPALQWQRSTDAGATWNDVSDGGAFAGSATAALRVTNATLAMNGHRFRVTATNTEGTATSNSGTLNVAATTGARLINLSTLASAGSGGSTLVMGFFISGTGSKTFSSGASDLRSPWTPSTVPARWSTRD